MNEALNRTWRVLWYTWMACFFSSLLVYGKEIYSLSHSRPVEDVQVFDWKGVDAWNLFSLLGSSVRETSHIDGDRDRVFIVLRFDWNNSPIPCIPSAKDGCRGRMGQWVDGRQVRSLSCCTRFVRELQILFRIVYHWTSLCPVLKLKILTKWEYQRIADYGPCNIFFFGIAG